jgi:hypothetical protein
LIKKLYEHEFGRLPASESKERLDDGPTIVGSTKESNAASALPDLKSAGDKSAADGPLANASSAAEVKKAKEAEKSAEDKDSDEEEDYEDDMNDWNDDDAWEMDADMGEVPQKSFKDGKNKKEDDFDRDFKTDKDKKFARDSSDEDFDIKKNDDSDKKKADDEQLGDLDKDFVDTNEDKFNKVLSTSKENGGLLASIGLKNKDFAENESLIVDEDQDSEEKHEKSYLFDTSKDRIAKKADENAKAQASDEEFDLGFSSSKKPSATSGK